MFLTLVFSLVYVPNTSANEDEEQETETTSESGLLQSYDRDKCSYDVDVSVIPFSSFLLIRNLIV